MAEQKYRVMKGSITAPYYNWTTGKTAGMMLTAIRDEKKFIGFKCPKCGKVYAPAKDICGECFVILDLDPIDVGPEGEVVTFTKVFREHGEQPLEPPYVLAGIKLSGADTALIAILDSGDKEVSVGMKVKPVWNDTPAGNFRDLKCFVPA